MTNSSVKVAKQLVRIARMLVAYNRNELESQLKKKRSDLKEDALNEHLDCLEGMDAKEQKAALYWINKKRLILPEDLSKFQEAMNLIDKQHLDFQKFEGPMEVINRNDKSTLRIKSQDIDFSPSSEKAFSSPYNAGDGVVIYDVKNSKEGQLAVRKAIDVNWGYDKNPWCLAARDSSNTYDELEDAWGCWKHYNAYPKRIAFKNGELLAFSAGDEKNHVQWWDKNDEPHYTIPGSNAVDDIEFLKKHGKINLLDGKNASPEMIEELAEDEDEWVRRAVAENPKTTAEVLMKLAEDEDKWVRYAVARNPKTPSEVLMKLAEDEDEWVRRGVVKNPNTPAEGLMKLAEDEDDVVRKGVAENLSAPVEALMKLTKDENKWVRQTAIKNSSIPVDFLMKLTEDEDKDVRSEVIKNPRIPVDFLMKLTEDENEWVRSGVAENPRTPAEVLRKLAEDKTGIVRYSVAKNPSIPVEVLMKLTEDESEWVRSGVAKNPRTPAEVLRKLAEDEDWSVRYEVAHNPRTPAEVLKKLAEDKNWDVKEVARRRLKQ